MDIFVWILFALMGGAVGAGLTSFLLRERIRKEGEQEKLEREAERLGLADQIQELKVKMNGVREEGKRYWDQLQDEKKKCAEAEKKILIIPGLEKNIERQKDQLAEITQQRDECEAKVSGLEEALAREKQDFEDCLIFVHGSHFLPGSVVRNIMRQSAEQS